MPLNVEKMSRGEYVGYAYDCSLHGNVIVLLLFFMYIVILCWCAVWCIKPKTNFHLWTMRTFEGKSLLTKFTTNKELNQRTKV